jgi:acyl carrier protein
MTSSDKIILFISDFLNVPKEKCYPQAKFVEDLGADSLDCAEMINEFAEEFSVFVSDEEMFSFKTIQDVLNFLKEKGIED